MFGFLGTIGQDIENGLNNLSGKVRTDLANTVADAAAAAGGVAAGAIAPSGQAPIVVPITKSQLVLGGIVAVLVLVIVVMLVRRRRS